MGLKAFCDLGLGLLGSWALWAEGLGFRVWALGHLGLKGLRGFRI